VSAWRENLTRATSSLESAIQLVQVAEHSGSEGGEQAAVDAARLLESAAASLRKVARGMRDARLGVTS
jgi:hypothetical protein